MDNLSQDLQISYSSPNFDYDELLIYKNKVKTFNLNNLNPKTQELKVFPISSEDYNRLLNFNFKPDWNNTLANNQNWISDNPEYFNNYFITPSALTMFRENSVTGFHLSSINESGVMEVFLDPRFISFSSNPNNYYSFSFNEFIIDGYYEDYLKKDVVLVPQSTMIVANPSLPYNPKSLLGENIRNFGIHRNVNWNMYFTAENEVWNNGFSLEWALLNFFESMPDITQGDAKPLPDSGIPYMEFQDGIEIILNLDEQRSALVDAYLFSLSLEEQKNILNQKIYMTPFQISSGQFEEIPTTEPNLTIFKNSIEKYVHNFISFQERNLNEKVNEFIKNLIIESLANFNWSSTETFNIQNNDLSYLFSLRESKNINEIVLVEGKSIFSNEENILSFQKMGFKNNNNASFQAVYEYLQFISNYEENNKIIKINSRIFETNYNIPNEPPYPGSISENNPEGVFPTFKERRLLKDILIDTLIEFNEVDNDIFLNTLTVEEQALNLSQTEKIKLIDYKKMNAITKKPIYFEYRTTLGFQARNDTYKNSLTEKITFKPDRSFSVTDNYESSLTRTNFDNYGIVVSSSYFQKNNLKYLSESEIQKAKFQIEKNLNNDSTLDSDVAIKSYLKQLPSNSTININSQTFFISGYGDAPDFKAPIIDFSKPLPNPKNEAIIYLNPSQFSVIKGRSIFLDRIINIKSNTNSVFELNNFIQFLNKTFDNVFSPINKEHPFLFYKNFDNINFFNIHTLRWNYPNIFIIVVSILFLVIFLSLLFLATYILTMVIKFLFETLGVSISIIRANGISRKKISLALVIIFTKIGTVFALVSLAIGYFITPLLFSFIGSFWFIPLTVPSFTFWFVIATAFLTTILITILVILVLKSFFKKSILSVINGSDLIKLNKLSKIMRKNNIFFYPFTKLRISMISSKTGKIFLISSLTILTFGLATSIFSLTTKVLDAKSLNSSTKTYSYAFDYSQPKYQTGLIKMAPFEELGEINPELGINSIVFDSFAQGDDTNPYYELLYDQNGYIIPNSVLAKRRVIKNTSIDNTTFPITEIIFYSNDPNYLRIPNDPNSNFKTYENILMPSMHTYNKYLFQNSSTTFNAIVFAEVLDINIGSFFGVNVGNLWERVSVYIPHDIRNQVLIGIEDYRENILKKYPWYQNFLLAQNPSKPVSETNPLKKPLELDVNKTFDKTKVRFKNEYLEALGVFLGDEELNQLNILISYNYTASHYEDEAYTYVNATLKNNGGYKPIKLMGIKNNSQYINLRSKEGENLNQLISSNSNKIIINNGASYANDLNVGDYIDVTIANDYYKDIKNLIQIANSDINFEPKKVSLQIVGISTDSVGQTFWINQDFANDLINMSSAEYISHIYDSPVSNKYTSRQDFKPILNLEKKIEFAALPYNGLFTKNEQPKFGTNALSLTSNLGIYPLFFEIDNFKVSRSKEQSYQILLELFNLEYNENDAAITEIYSKIPGIDNNTKMMEFLKDNFSSPDILIDKLSHQFNNFNIVTSVISLDGIFISDEIFNLVSEASTILSLVVTFIFIPLLLITMLVSMFSLADDFRKTLSILRILGINKRSVMISIGLIYAPIFVIGIIFGSLVSFLINLSFQSLVFSALTVFIFADLNLFIYLTSSMIILILISFVILVVIFILSKEKLENSIKF